LSSSQTMAVELASGLRNEIVGPDKKSAPRTLFRR
jgi:hypothetical protein